MGKAPSKGLTEQNEIYRRTNMSTGVEELFYIDAGGTEHAVGGTAGGGNHAITHADGGADELVEGSIAPSTQAFGDAAAVGADTTKAAPRLHKHGMMADPVPGHVAAGDPHTQYATDGDLTTHAATSAASTHGNLGHSNALDHSNSLDHAQLHAAAHADGGSDEIIEGSFVPSTQAFGDSASVGADTAKAAPRLHKHGMPADPVTAHVAAGDPHTQYSTNVEFDDHNARHEPGGADPMAVDAAAATGSLRTLGTTSLKAAAGDHTTPAMTATVAGHVPTPPNDATKFLDGTGVFDTVKDSDLSTSDITTNDASAAKHGFMMKYPGGTTNFLRADGTFAAPPGGGSGPTMGTATLDFGATPAEEASVVVADAAIDTADHIMAWFQRDSTADNNADEHEQAQSICPLICGDVIDAVSFKITAKPQLGFATGQFTVHWSYQ